MGGLLAFFSLVSVLIAALGIYGLSVYSVMKRAKEAGIRKISGASLPEVMKSLTSELNRVVLVALLPAFVLIYLLMSRWLPGFAGRA
jgi:putative ABC transport system permease protein